MEIRKVQRCVISDNVYLHRQILAVIPELGAMGSVRAAIDFYTVVFRPFLLCEITHTGE